MRPTLTLNPERGIGTANRSVSANLLSSSSTQSYPQAAAVSKFLSSHSSVAGSLVSFSVARCTPYLSPNKQIKNGAQRPMLSKHMRRTYSLLCSDWLLFHRKSTGKKEVPRSWHNLFSSGKIRSCKKSLSAWKSWKVEHTNGRMTCLRADSLLAADKLDPSRSFGIDCEKMTPNTGLCNVLANKKCWCLPISCWNVPSLSIPNQNKTFCCHELHEPRLLVAPVTRPSTSSAE